MLLCPLHIQTSPNNTPERLSVVFMAVTVIVSAEVEAGVGGSSTRHIREPILLLLGATVPVYALPRKCTVTVVPGFRPQPNRAARAGALCSYYFGKALHKRMAADGNVVPIGLIKNEWGGSMIEAWVPEVDAITGETYCTDRNTREGRTPGKLYNSMIMPVSNLTIKGVLWYQVRIAVTCGRQR